MGSSRLRAREGQRHAVRSADGRRAAVWRLRRAGCGALATARGLRVRGLRRAFVRAAEELSQGCLDTLVLVLISEHIAPALERLALGKNAAAFSPVGAMLLDKDVRAVVAFLAGLTHRTVRDPFARLSQIALVLNLGEPSEIFDYNWGEAGSPIAWRLTADEARPGPAPFGPRAGPHPPRS